MSDETIKQVDNALKEFGEKLAEMVLFTQELFKKMTPEQRAVVDFLAENPKVAEAFQELNQKLARQKVIEGATKEAAQPEEPLIKDEKVRKCAKLWLEINEIYSVTYHKRRGGGSYLELDNMPMRNGCCIVFQDLIEELKDGQVYTAAELCGEEEE